MADTSKPGTSDHSDFFHFRQCKLRGQAGPTMSWHDSEAAWKALRDMLCAAGLTHPRELGPEHIVRRVSPVEIRALPADDSHACTCAESTWRTF